MLTPAMRQDVPRHARLCEAVRDACETEIRALKPGNVGMHAAGHSMSVADFMLSAAAMAGPLTAPGRSVGRRILAAVEATRGVVGCNTNLGIVLLCTPLVEAALRTHTASGLRVELKRVLAQLDVADAELAYRAIRLANPGGLGDATRHDVRDTPTVSLLAAMREASLRDSIARQYATDYVDIFELGVPLYRSALQRWNSPEWALVAAYLAFLGRLPDSHIVRKQGETVAQRVSREAAPLAAALAAAIDPNQLSQPLLQWDAALKRDGINPGTSADLSVATLLAARIEDMLEKEFTATEPVPGSRVIKGG